MVKYFNIKDCNTIDTSFDANVKLLKILIIKFHSIKVKMQGVSYLFGVGWFKYVMLATSFDLAFVMSMINQHIFMIVSSYWNFARTTDDMQSMISSHNV